MVPTPQEGNDGHSTRAPEPDKTTVVISGVSGTFPGSPDVKHFTDALYNKDYVATRFKNRWDYKHPELPRHVGRVPNLDRLDAQFFKVPNRLAKVCDPTSNKILEQTYGAIYDAGLSPDQLEGKNVGVYVGASFLDSEKLNITDVNCTSSSTLLGISKAMIANRISYWLDVKGPSMTFDNLCGSFATALEQAWLAIGRGDCDSAIVVAGNVCLHPHPVVHYGRCIPCCEDGKTKSFDQNADGCLISEAICAVYLQKAEDALRIYSEIVHVKTGFTSLLERDNGIKKYGFYRDPQKVADFLQTSYKEANVSPQEIEYVDALGCGVPDADKSELEALAEVHCKDRTNHLLVGSVTSNTGYTEAASVAPAIIKVLLGYSKGMVAPTLHCSTPRQDVAALHDGRMRIVTQEAPLGRNSYAAVHGANISGLNFHVILRGCYRPKVQPIEKLGIPYLLTVSGRNESSAETFIANLKKQPIDINQLALLHHIHEVKSSGHLGRGYVILDSDDKNGTVSLSEKVQYYDDVKRPLWFVYSGMGSQWTAMGAELMRIPVFAATIARCDKVLAPKGLDIVQIITATDKTIFDNILHSFVGIAAVQIGLTDVLFKLGLVPDNIIGHSVGELGCSYADGCLTLEETILSAYSRGLVSLQTPLIRGSMAAVGIGYQQVVKMCPPEIEVACHNGPESSTISGPTDAMKQFVAELTAQGVFAKEVPCSNIAYHSRYIAPAGPKLLEYLTAVIKDPKRRSERWVSTSVPQDRWDEERTQLCSAWYHTNNLLSPVLFEETLRLVPAGAVLVEVAPHGLLQAILKRSMHPDCIYIPLTKRGHPDNSMHLLEAIGKIYSEGYDLTIRNLYPDVEFPVPSGTSPLSQLIDWSYAERWPLTLFQFENKEQTTKYNLNVTVHDEEYSYLRNHVIRGKMVFPYSAVLVSVWDTLAMSLGRARKAVSVQFTDVHLFAQPLLHERRTTSINVTILQGTGEFEVINGCSKVATGYITTLDDKKEKLSQYKQSDKDMAFDKDGVYDLLKERDYMYLGDFRSIYKSNYSFTEAQLVWNNNWVTIIDGMLQMNVLQRDHDTVSRPSHIHKLTINLKAHDDTTKMHVVDGRTTILTEISTIFGTTRCGGILIEMLKFYDLPPLNPTNLEIQIKKGEYVPLQENVAVECGVTLQSPEVGDIKSLCWVETPQPVQSSSEVIVTVRYVGINTFDVKKATGVIPARQGYLKSNGYGMDYSGWTNKGERVMGIVRGGAASGRLRALPELLWPAPAHWTLEDAATVPFAYAQAFYCLGIKAQLYPGMTILVHGGAGALGQAAISIALAHQCKVFTTVSDDRKKQFLLRLFPSLTEDVIGNSRDESFGDLVLEGTEGKGCDIIISCVSTNLTDITLKCASYCGITFDMVQNYSENTFAFGMFHLTNQRSYVVIDSFSIFEDIDIAKSLRMMMSEGIARGYVRPLSRVTFAAQEARRAFRLLSASRHRGRVLLRLRDAILPAQPRLTCSASLYQLVVCKDTFFCHQFVDRLIKSGARKIIIQCSTLSPLFYFKKQLWESIGVELNTSLRDVADTKHLETLLNDNFEGIYTICIKESDATVISTLDEVSRKQCPSLKYFVKIHTDNLTDQVYLTRKQDGLPVTTVNLPSVLVDITNLEGRDSVSQCSVLNTIERALYSSQRSLRVHLKKRASLLQQLANKTGLSIPKNAGVMTTLKEMEFNKSHVPTIVTFLENEYNTSLIEGNIPDLTIQMLQDIESKLSEPDFKEVKGLGTLFSILDRDNFRAETDMVVMPTLFKTLKVKHDEVDLDQQYLWIVPGLEGSCLRFKAFCEGLKIPALVLQPRIHHKHESFRETARRYVEVLKKKATVEYENFYLLGYETGIFTALEMAAILEQNGLTGTVFCIGGYPEDILQIIKDNLESFGSEDELQDAIVKHFIELASEEEIEEIGAVLKNYSTWQDKMEECIRIFKNRTAMSSVYLRSLFDAVYERIMQVLHYDTQYQKLKSRIVFLRTESTIGSVSIDDIESMSQQPIRTYELASPISYAMGYPRTATIINANIGNDGIEKYEMQNHCESFVTNMANSLLTLQEDEVRQD